MKGGSNNSPVVVMWFRRDLRLQDNAALHGALRSGLPVLPLFIFDRDILDLLPSRCDARVEFIHQAVKAMHEELQALGSGMVVKFATPEAAWQEVLAEYNVKQVWTNRDYEPYATGRDKKIGELLAERGIPFHTRKDHVIFQYDEVLKDDGTPYTVFTPYSKKWRARLAGGAATPLDESYYLKPYPTEKYFHAWAKMESPPALPSLEALGFAPAGIAFPSPRVSRQLIQGYDQTRNFPAIEGTSRLSVHFRFGTVSIREKARKALALNDTFLNELIWRDFYVQILAHFPHVQDSAFRPAFDKIAWRQSEEDFQRWSRGETGYPIVDAGMRQLNATGFMHNRVRMIVASFFTKHLLLDWRLGEAYFAEKLLDFDLAANCGGWQWAAGCGTDAAPYFRIFNPETQQQKFDAQGEYVRSWVKEWKTSCYPSPMVEHTFARQRCLATYKAGISNEPEPLNLFSDLR